MVEAPSVVPQETEVTTFEAEEAFIKEVTPYSVFAKTPSTEMVYGSLWADAVMVDLIVDATGLTGVTEKLAKATSFLGEPKKVSRAEHLDAELNEIFSDAYYFARVTKFRVPEEEKKGDF